MNNVIDGRHQLNQWLPSNSPDRDRYWPFTVRPRRMWLSLNMRRPEDSAECTYCIDLAAWHCPLCAVLFCSSEVCKGEHEYEHTLGRLGGPKDD